MSKDEREIPTGRFSRFARLSALSTQVTASVLTQKARSVFQKDEDRLKGLLTSQIRNAERIVDTMGNLKGAVMKIGQMFSLHDGEGVSPEVAAILARLQNQAPRIPWSRVREQFITSFGKGPEDLFQSFDTEPVAAASLGQVYRAVLPDGTPVAVKVQYPGIRDTLSSDLRNLRSMLEAMGVVSSRMDTRHIFAEIEALHKEEADYLNEAINLEEFRHLFRDDPRVVIPRYFPPFSSETVLTMEWLDGQGLSQALEQGLSEDDANALGLLTFDIFMKQLLVFGTLHADPHHGNFLVLPGGRIGLLDFGCVKRFPPGFLEGYRALTRATLRRNRAEMIPLLVDIGFLINDQNPRANDLLCEITEVALLPFKEDQEFDFGKADLHGRLRDLPKRMMGIGKVSFPPDALYLNRVFMGEYFLLRRLKARANWHSMVMAHLGQI